MTGHGTPSVSKIEVEIPSDLYDLCQHLAKHVKEEPMLMLEIATVMGLADIGNSAQKMCFTMELLVYMENHSKRLGLGNFTDGLSEACKN